MLNNFWSNFLEMLKHFWGEGQKWIAYKKRCNGVDTAATNNSIENLEATVEEPNNKLKKTNENITQLLETANKALTKATNNEQSSIHTKSEPQKTNKKLAQLWVTAKEEALSRAIISIQE